MAIRHAGLAGADAGPRGVLPDRRARHRAGHHLPLGRADDHDGTRVRWRGAVRRCPHPLDHPGARRPSHVEVARHRDRSARPDQRRSETSRVRCRWRVSRLRRRRDALGPAGDVLEPGRALQRGPGRPGAELDQQAVERLSLDPPEGRSRGPRRRATDDDRGPLDPLAAGAGPGRGRRADRQLRLLAGRARAL